MREPMKLTEVCYPPRLQCPSLPDREVIMSISFSNPIVNLVITMTKQS